MSHAELVLLGLLAGGPASAYRLIREVETMRVAQWAKVAESTLYAVLRRLEGERLLASRRAAGERQKDRTVYRITAPGRRRLRELIEQGVAEPAPIYSDVLVASVFAVAAGEERQLAHAESSLRAAEDRLERARREADLSEFGRVILTFYRQVARAQRAAVRSLAALTEDAVKLEALEIAER